MAMHVPAAKPACWTGEASPRPWLAMDLFRLKTIKGGHHDPAIECKEWMPFKDKGAEEVRRWINGNACDGCARLP
jgi:hypothetical protein